MSKTRTIGKWKMTAKPKWLDNITAYEDGCDYLTANIITSNGWDNCTVSGTIITSQPVVTFEIGE